MAAMLAQLVISARTKAHLCQLSAQLVIIDQSLRAMFAPSAQKVHSASNEAQRTVWNVKSAHLGESVSVKAQLTSQPQHHALMAVFAGLAQAPRSKKTVLQATTAHPRRQTRASSTIDVRRASSASLVPVSPRGLGIPALSPTIVHQGLVSTTMQRRTQQK
jgi:hypothetical protein